MTGMEFMTAVENRLPIIVIVATTACTEPSACIRSGLSRPGFRHDLANPDFAHCARLRRLRRRVDRTEDFARLR